MSMLYVVAPFNKLTKEYIAPTPVAKLETAKNHFIDMFLDMRMHDKAEHIDLYQLATFDTETGKYTNEAPTIIITGFNALEMAVNTKFEETEK